MRVFTRKLYEEMQVEGKNNFNTFLKKFRKICSDYNSHYKAIESSLPIDIIKLEKEYDLHDSKVVSIEKVSEYELILTIDCAACMKNIGIYKLVFTGVKFAITPSNICGSYCIWSEVYLYEKESFELNILMDGPGKLLNLSEFKIIANNLSIRSIEE